MSPGRLKKLRKLNFQPGPVNAGRSTSLALVVSVVRCSGMPGPLSYKPDMRNLLILFVTAASLLLGACGSNVEESAWTPPISAVEESVGTVVEESAGAPISAVKKSAGPRIRAISAVELARSNPSGLVSARPGRPAPRGLRARPHPRGPQHPP